MASFITLIKRGMYNDDHGSVVVNVDSIVSMDHDREYHQTEVKLNNGTSFAVSETPEALLRMIRDKRQEDRDASV